MLFALFSLPFWFAGVTLGKSALAGSLIKENIEIGQQKWRSSQHLPWVKSGKPKWSAGGKEFEGRTRDLQGASMVTAAWVNGKPQTHIRLTEGVRQHIIGEGLSRQEQVWLTSAVNEHLKSLGIDTTDAARDQKRWLESGEQRPLNDRSQYFDDVNGLNGGYFGDDDLLNDNDWKKK